MVTDDNPSHFPTSSSSHFVSLRHTRYWLNLFVKMVSFFSRQNIRCNQFLVKKKLCRAHTCQGEDCGNAFLPTFRLSSKPSKKGFLISDCFERGLSVVHDFAAKGIATACRLARVGPLLPSTGPLSGPLRADGGRLRPCLAFLLLLRENFSCHFSLHFHSHYCQSQQKQ